MSSGSIYNLHKESRAVLKKYRKCPASISIELYAKHFRFKDQNMVFPYESPMKAFLEAVRAQRIPSDLIPALSAAKTPYYEGCLIVELIDHRTRARPNEASTSTLDPHAPRSNTPPARIVLHPTPASLWEDICELNEEVSGGKWDDYDALQLESRILAATAPPLFLGTSFFATRVANVALALTSPSPIVPASHSLNASAAIPRPPKRDAKSTEEVEDTSWKDQLMRTGEIVKDPRGFQPTFTRIAAIQAWRERSQLDPSLRYPNIGGQAKGSSYPPPSAFTSAFEAARDPIPGQASTSQNAAYTPATQYNPSGPGRPAPSAQQLQQQQQQQQRGASASVSAAGTPAPSDAGTGEKKKAKKKKNAAGAKDEPHDESMTDPLAPLIDDPSGAPPPDPKKGKGKGHPKKSMKVPPPQPPPKDEGNESDTSVASKTTTGTAAPTGNKKKNTKAAKAAAAAAAAVSGGGGATKTVPGGGGGATKTLPGGGGGATKTLPGGGSATKTVPPSATLPPPSDSGPAKKKARLNAPPALSLPLPGAFLPAQGQPQGQQGQQGQQQMTAQQYQQLQQILQANGGGAAGAGGGGGLGGMTAQQLDQLKRKLGLAPGQQQGQGMGGGSFAGQQQQGQQGGWNGQ